MGLARKIKNTLNHLPHVLGAINFGTILDGIATTADTAAAGVTELNTSVTDLQTYSDMPVQIGTWVDGTPVWRWAYKIECKTDMDADEYGNMYDDRLFAVSLPVTNKDDVVILNIVCTLCKEVDAPSLMDDSELPRSFGVQGMLNFDLDDGEGGVIAILPFEHDSLINEGFIGYAVFATPETNIASDDEGD